MLLPDYRFREEILRYKVASSCSPGPESNTILRKFCGNQIALD